MSKVQRTTTFTGNAGEYLVVGELLRRDAIAALAPRNTPAFDVLVSNGELSVNVRVKTRSPRADTWVFRVSATEEFRGREWQRPILSGRLARDFVVLVELPEVPTPPNYWVIPSAEIEPWLQGIFRGVLETPGRNGRQRNPDNWERRFGGNKAEREWLEQYAGRWDFILDAVEMENDR